MGAYKDKNTGKWFAKFSYIDSFGKRRQKKKGGFRTKHDAKEFEMTFIISKSRSPMVAFESVAEEYMNEVAANIRPSTYSSKKHIVRDVIVPHFVLYTLADIGAGEVLEFYQELQAEGRSQSFIKTVHVQLHSIFAFASNRYGIMQNPCNIAKPTFKEDKREACFWTVDEFNRFMESQMDMGGYAPFLLLFWTGMRSGEMLALFPEDFDFENDTVSISKTYQRIRGEDFIAPPKTPHGNRVITVPKFVMDAISTYIDYWGRDEGRRIFPHTKHFLRSRMKRGCATLGLEPIRIHDLRHSHASYLISEGIPALVVAERLGHESVRITLDTYSHLYPGAQAELAKKLDEKWANAIPKPNTSS